MNTGKKIVVIGAGFYGLSIAIKLAKSGCEVTIFESQPEPFLGASKLNQARIHNGYHYPRSVRTAKQSSKYYARFTEEFEDAISFKNNSYYLIARGSRVSSKYFESFCNSIGAPISMNTSEISKMVNWKNIEGAYLVNEKFFNWLVIREKLIFEANLLGIEISLNSKVERINEHSDGVTLDLPNNISPKFDMCFVTTYGQNVGHPVDEMIKESTKFQLCEIVHIEVPKQLENINLTVMDGPFWSLTEFPSTSNHLLTHVRYTPHLNSIQFKDLNFFEDIRCRDHTYAELMIRDASKHLPAISEARLVKSDFIVKSISKDSNHFDSRPIVIRRTEKVVALLGGKLDNIYDALDFIDSYLSNNEI